MGYVDRDALLAEDLFGEDLEVPGLGTVRVRGLSRVEVLEVSKVDGTPAMERALIARGLVEPVLTEEDVEAFQRAKRSLVVQVIVDKIAELSGVGEYARNAAYKSVPGDAGTGV